MPRHRLARRAAPDDAALAWLRGGVEAGSLAAVRATARVLKDEGRLEEALYWFLRGDKAGAPVAFHIAQTMEKLNRVAEALPWRRKSFEQGDYGSLQWAARRLDAAGRWDEAFRWYLRAVDEPGGFLFLGRAAELLEKSQGTEAALAWLGERGDAGDAMALGAAASLLTEAGGGEAAFAWLRERAEAGDAGAWREIAVILQRAGNEAEALEHYDRAAGEGDKLALMWGAEMLKLAGQKAKALKWYERAANAGDPYALLHAARILREAGQVEEALTTSILGVWGKAGGPVRVLCGPPGHRRDRRHRQGIISGGGGGGGGDNSGGTFDPCWLYFTDIGLANSAFPGTVARY